MDERCENCRRKLTPDEVALTKKLVNRGTTRFWCLTCLAAHFQVTEADLEQKISDFRAMGCTLFEP